MTDPVTAWKSVVRSRAVSRARYVGQEQPWDEAVLEHLEALGRENERLRAALEQGE